MRAVTARIGPATLDRKEWKRNLARYLEPDAGRSLGQIVSTVAPYLGVWGLAAILKPGAWAAVGLGLVATEPGQAWLRVN